MSTITTVSLTTGLTAFLNALASGGEGGQLELHSRSPHGFGYESQRPIIPRGGWTCLPPFAIALLEAGWEVRVGAAARRRGAEDFASLSALFAVFHVAVDFRPAPGESSRWRRDDAAASSVLARVADFSLPPALVVDAFGELAAIWPLADPVRDIENARRIQRQLAERLGASMRRVTMPIPSRTTAGGYLIERPADDPLAYLPLPGSIVRQVGVPAPAVGFVEAVPDRSYSISEIEAALGHKEAR